MLQDSLVFSGFSVIDIDASQAFYANTLEQHITKNDSGMLMLHLKTGGTILLYPKPNHVPAEFTVLNFPVPNIEAAVAILAEKGVQFEQYAGMDIGDDGIFRGGGPLIAWFKDPSGNVLSVLEQ